MRIKPGQFVIGSFFASDNTCPHCRAGFPDLVPTPCLHRRLPRRGGPSPAGRWDPRRPPEPPAQGLVPGFLALSDVMGTGWFAAVSANVQPDMTVAVVGDGGDGRRPSSGAFGVPAGWSASWL